MNKSNIKGNVILMITAFIWGTAFVAQSVGMDYVGPFTFITARYIVGGLFLIPCIYLLDKMNKKTVKESSQELFCQDCMTTCLILQTKAL